MSEQTSFRSNSPSSLLSMKVCFQASIFTCNLNFFRTRNALHPWWSLPEVEICIRQEFLSRQIFPTVWSCRLRNTENIGGAWIGTIILHPHLNKPNRCVEFHAQKCFQFSFFRKKFGEFGSFCSKCGCYVTLCPRLNKTNNSTGFSCKNILDFHFFVGHSKNYVRSVQVWTWPQRAFNLHILWANSE